ncbi:MAG: carboxypeptidase-like regulatory domain-containing protein, partial [Acidobacteriia bacterium]|nr:carboxypeptidase-like regulatory domain-containing protein [Terriglobia bacterium]
MRSLLVLYVIAAAAAAPISVTVSITDQSNNPAAGVHVALKNGPNLAAAADTGPDGRADFKDLAPGVYEVAASKDGYEPIRKAGLDLSATTSIELTLVPALAEKQTVNVTAQGAPVEEGASPSVSVAGRDASQLPGRPATVADALPLLPGVARTPGGGLQISGSG